MTDHFRVMSALLSYPSAELVDALPELDAVLDAQPAVKAQLRPLFAHLAGHDLIELEETYVATFDRVPVHSLHLFEHIHGESRDRGQAMVDLIEEYRKHGLEPAVDELPDYLPQFLELLGVVEPAVADVLLGDAVHVVAYVAGKLAGNDSPYACVLDALAQLSQVAPLPLAEPPIRDMDEMLETFGPGADGTEPLLKPAADPSGVSPLNFHPRRTAAAATPRP